MDVAGVGPVKGKKVILRRHRNNINENLNHLENVSIKKKIAQDIYYRRQPLGTSPLLKEPVDEKGSVHERLGENGIQKKVLLSRSKFRWRPRPVEGLVTRKYRNKNFGRNRRPYIKNLAQKRLETLKQRLQLSNTEDGSFQLRRPLQLRRPHGHFQKLENIRIQIKNSQHQQMPLQHSIHNSLDPTIQMNIQRLQQRSSTLHHIPNLPITSGEFGFTKINLNQRFTNLP